MGLAVESTSPKHKRSLLSGNLPILIAALLCFITIVVTGIVIVVLSADISGMQNDVAEESRVFQKEAADVRLTLYGLREMLLEEYNSNRVKRGYNVASSGYSSGPSGGRYNEDCPEGPRGPKGEPGERGEPGPPGQPGRDGPPGEEHYFEPVKPPCISCPMGQPGEQGQAGRPGRAGQDGQPGNDGTPGRDGQPGPKGPPGPQGSRGDLGVQGEPGPPGSDGTKTRRVTGPKGEPGPEGPPGLQGEAGLDGETGDVGQPGEPGPQGAPGDEGRDGVPGENGKAGKDAEDATYCPCPARVIGHPVSSNAYRTANENVLMAVRESTRVRTGNVVHAGRVKGVKNEGVAN